MCKFWLQGKCLRQDDCLFAHGEHELRPSNAEDVPSHIRDTRAKQDEYFAQLRRRAWRTEEQSGGSAKRARSSPTEGSQEDDAEALLRQLQAEDDAAAAAEESVKKEPVKTERGKKAGGLHAKVRATPPGASSSTSSSSTPAPAALRPAPPQGPPPAKTTVEAKAAVAPGATAPEPRAEAEAPAAQPVAAVKEQPLAREPPLEAQPQADAEADPSAKPAAAPAAEPEAKPEAEPGVMPKAMPKARVPPRAADKAAASVLEMRPPVPVKVAPRPAAAAKASEDDEVSPDAPTAICVMGYADPVDIFLGAKDHAYSSRWLEGHKVRNLVKCVHRDMGKVPWLRTDPQLSVITLCLEWTDLRPDIEAHFAKIKAGFDELILKPGSTLFFCKRGRHRSAAMLSMYLLYMYRWELPDAVMDRLRRSRDKVEFFERSGVYPPLAKVVRFWHHWLIHDTVPDEAKHMFK